MALDFALDPEQEVLVRTIRAFAQRELAPHSGQWDRDRVFPAEAWRQMGELGLLGLRVPAALGGQEADLVTVGLAMEEIARGDFSCTYGIQLSTLAGEIIGKRGDAALRERWLPPMTRGEAVIALALTEPGGGLGRGRLAMRAEREGDELSAHRREVGHQPRHGRPGGDRLRAHGRAAGRAGVTAFLVPLDLPGVARSALRDMGSHAIARAVLAFDHVRVPASHRLGEEGTGFYEVMRGFDFNRVLISLACLGAAQISLEETMAYVKERQAFGRPLARFEGVTFPIAEAAT